MAARHREPYLDYHPGPGDASAAFAEEAMRRAAGSPHVADGDRVSTNISHIESPSVLIAWRLRMAEIGIQLPLVPFYEAVQQPDPRVAKGQLNFTLWTYEGTTAQPSLGVPDAKASEAIAAIASIRYHLPTWADKAQATAQQFGPGWEQHLLATMLHPPAAPDHIHPLDWVPRMQLAAALVLGCQADGFQLLRTVALGPVDWVVDGAITALSELALRTPTLVGEVDQLFAYLRSQIPTEGFTSYAYPLASAWLRLVPEQDPRRAELLQWRHQILAGQGGNSTSSGAIGLIDGLNMEDYAEFTVKQEMLQAEAGGPSGGLGAMVKAVAGSANGAIARLADEYGLPMVSPTHTYSAAWAEALNNDPRGQLAFEQCKARIKLGLQGIDPDSPEARLSHNLMAGKGLDQEEEMAKAQAAQQEMAAGGGGDPDPVVFPGQPVARLSDYVGMMKKMQGGDFNGALSAYGLNMATYTQVAQAWGTKFGTDPTLSAKMSAMMA